MKRDLINMQNFKWLIFLCLFPSALMAEIYHYKNTFVGGRAATMGGAFKAISDDASGAYYNPSGLVYAVSSSVSGSANAFDIQSSTYKQTLGTEDWERKTSSLEPNFFGLVKKNDRSAFAFSYVLSDINKERQSQIYRNLDVGDDAIDTYALNLDIEDSIFYLGPSYAYSLSDKLSLGVSLYYQQRRFFRSQNQYIRFDDQSEEVSYSHVRIKEKGIRAILGVMYEPRDRWSLGVTLSKSEVLASLEEETANKRRQSDSETNFISRSSLDERDLPIEVGFGVAYFPSDRMIMAFDFDYYVSTDDETRNIWNASLGIEWFYNHQHAFRGGLFTNNTFSEELSANSTAPNEHINMKGIALGYSIYSQLNEITLGVVHSRGSGEVQVFQDSSARRDLERSKTQIILSSTYSF